MTNRTEQYRCASVAKHKRGVVVSYDEVANLESVAVCNCKQY